MTDFTQRWNRRARLIAIVALGVLAAGWLPAAVYADDDDDDNRSWSTTTLRISEARWTASEGRLTVRGRGARDETTVTVKNAATGAVLDTDRSNDDGEWRVTVRNPSPVPTRVRVESYRRTAAEAAVQGAPTTPPPPPPAVTLTGLAIAGPTSVNEGATATYTATATYSNSTTKAVAATFTATGSATISGGTLTAAQVTGNGAATVNASYTEGGVTRTATRAVTIVDTTPPPPVVTLTALAINGPTSVNEGATATYTATATYSNSTTKAVTATYTVTGNATMSGATLTAAQVTANGSATVTASYTEGGVTRTATRNVTIVNVAATLTSLAISGPVTVNEGATGAFTATATYSDATTRTVTPTYTVTGPGTMAAGTFTAGQVTGNGTATINASYTEGGVTRTASRSVTILDLTALSGLTINGPATAAEGTTATYTATASYTNAASKTVTPTWSVTGPATITTAGILTAGQVTGNQSAALTASYTEGGVTRTATANLSITDSVTPPPPGTGSHASRVTAFTGTATCLACHRDRALEVHASAHYQFKGATPDVPNLAGARQGKMGGINDFCIYPDINWIGKLTNVSGQQVDGGCGRCHAGLGDKPVDTASPTDAHLQNIDCLVCHSSAYKRTVAMVGTTYKFVPDTANMSVTLLAAAQDLKRPDRGICLNCHSKAGGGNNFKRGDLEEAHREPPTRAFDVHMSSTALGGGGLVCTSCHTTANHRISGRGVDLRETDNAAKPSCTNCHPARPHNNADRDKHVGRVHCTTCHIPTFAKIAPTDMERDWSVPGDLDVAKGLYDPHMVKQANVIPEYKFWNGQSYIYNFGTAATLDASGRVSMAKPLGSITTTGSKIYPFKHHLGKQPKETTSQRLLPLKIGIFFSTNDFQQAVEQGAIGVGWGYSGHDFALTERYLGLYHEVSPKEQALTCNNCHTAPKRLPLADLGYTPFTTVGGRALCSSCHGSESYPAATRFTQVHSRHVNSERLNCNRCHGFSTGPTQ